ncbi:hypothetical protein V6C27_07735 [Peptococcaceae bacterium 1198_IL3148]
MVLSDAKKLKDLIKQELMDIKEHQANLNDDFYLSQVEIDYLHFVDIFIKDYSKEQIMAALDEMYQQGEIVAIKNPQGLMFDIKLNTNV